MRAATALRGSALRLALARTLAWALLTGGWLALGALGAAHLPHQAGGLAPLALWLLSIGATHALLNGRVVHAAALRPAIALAGAFAATALGALAAGGGAVALLLAAAAWGALLVLASTGVRALRATLAQPAPAPLLPALAGGLLAWQVAGDAVRPAGAEIAAVAAALAVAIAALGIACAVPRDAPSRRGACRAGLFDCAWPLPPLASWRTPGDWPRHAALLTMLPMMATLPAMSDWCGAALGLAPAGHVGLHLLAMALPALLLRPLLARPGATPVQHGALLALLAAGALMLVLRPGVAGLLAASLLHAAAWSLAWAAPMLARDAAAAARKPAPLHDAGSAGRLTGRAASPAAAAAVSAAAGAAALLALGTAVASHGPGALAAVHLGLSIVALAGAALSAAGRAIPLRRGLR